MWQAGVTITLLQQICGAGSDSFVQTHKLAHDMRALKHFRVNR